MTNTSNASASANSAANLRPAAITERVLGDFEIIREIGRGGMGVIYEARQLSLNRRVALKVLPFTSLLNPLQLARFENEARAAACLHHPHIVPVYGTGSDRGIHYYAMQFINGQDLSAILRSLRKEKRHLSEPSTIKTTRFHSSPDHENTSEPDHGDGFLPSQADAAQLDQKSSEQTQPTAQPSPLNPSGSRQDIRHIAELAKQAALALDYAHNQGVTHRDVKPSNLMIDASGKLWLTDFGLARMENDASLTVSGDVMGTLQYMSPEQTLGRRGVIDQRSDIYSLGATLYEMVTLKPMFPEGDRAFLLRQIAEADPPAPSFYNAKIPRDLETIILKAISKDAIDRYPTAAEMAEDLQRFLDEKPIMAKRPNLPDRVWKWSRRHRGLSLLTLLFVILFSVLTFITSAVLSLQNAKLNNLSYVQIVSLTLNALKEKDPYEAESYLQALNSIFPSPEMRGLEWQYIQRICPSSQFSKQISEEPLYTARLSPSGEVIAVAGREATIYLLDAMTLEILDEIVTKQKEVNGLDFSPDGLRLASTGDDGSVKVWSLKDHELLVSTDPTEDIAFGVKFIAGGEKLISTAKDSVIRIWNARTGKLTATFGEHSEDVTAFITTPDERIVASADKKGPILIWDIDNQRVIRRIDRVRNRATAMAFSPLSDSLITGHLNGEIWEWGLDLDYRSLIGNGPDEIQCLSFHPTENHFVTTDVNGSVRMWTLPQRVASSREIVSPLIPSQTWTVRYDKRLDWCGVSQDGKMAAVLIDSTLEFYDFATGNSIKVPLHEKLDFGDRPRHNAKQLCSFSPDGRHFVCVNQIFERVGDNPLDWKWKCFFDGAKVNRVFAVAFTPDSQTIVSNRLTGQIDLHSSANGKSLAEPFQNPEWEGKPGFQSEALAVSPDGKFAACSTMNNDIDILDIQNHQYVRTLSSGPGGQILNLQFSPDSQSLISCGANEKFMRIWDLNTGNLRIEIPMTSMGHERPVDSATWANNGRWLVTATNGDKGEIHIWDLQLMRKIWVRSEAGDVVNFLKDGTTMTTAAFETGRHTVWDLSRLRDDMDQGRLPNLDDPNSTENRAQMNAWQGHDGECYAAIFTIDGKRLYTFGETGDLEGWSMSAIRFRQVLSAPESNVPPKRDLDFSISRDGNQIASVGEQGIHLFKLNGDRYELLASTAAPDVCSVAFHPDQTQLITGHKGGQIKFWTTKSLEELGSREIKLDAEVNRIVVSPDGQLIVLQLNSSEDRVRLYNSSFERQLPKLEFRSVESVCFSPDGKLLAFGSQDDVMLWNLETQQTERLIGHTDGVTAVCFNHAGDKLATGASDRRVIIWDLATRKIDKDLKGHKSKLRSLVFSPDDRSLVSSGKLDDAKIWHMATGREVGDFLEKNLHKIDFTTDGSKIVYLPRDKHPVVFDLSLPSRKASQN